MKKYLKGLKGSYFVFYAVTYCGSALTSVSSFLMVERLFGSIACLGLALALRTAFIALASPFVARALAKVSMKAGFWISQILGLLFLIPLYLGVSYQLPTLFIVGITIGGLSSLILNIVGTAYLKMSSTEGPNDFRSNQGQLQLVVGICFTACSLLSPFLLRFFTYQTVLAIDCASYVAGTVYVYIHRSMFSRWDKPARVESAPKVSKEAGLTIWSRASLSFALLAGSAYALKGLAPMLAGSGTLTSSMAIDPTARQSLWACEAIAGILGGLLYKKYHHRLGRSFLFEAGLFSAAILLPVLLIPNFWMLSACVFLLSLAMLMTFMKFRDDFLAGYKTKESAIWAAGFVNLVSNCILTISPLVISLFVSRFSLTTSIAIALAFQICLYFGIQLLRMSARIL